MAVKIRLLRMGKIRNPQYRVVVSDSRVKRDGKAIEHIGIYHPKEHPSLIEIDSERAQYWLSVGAQPSEPVQRLLEKTGDWQKFKGLPAPEPLLVAPARADRKAAYEVEAKAALGVAEAKPEPKKAEPRKKAAAPKATAPKADAEPKATVPTADAEPKATVPTADAEPKATVPTADAEPKPEVAASEESAGADADTTA